MIAMRNIFLFTALIGLFGGCASQSTSSHSEWMKNQGMRAPTNSSIYICHTFGCKLKYHFQPNHDDIQQLAEILKKGNKNPAEERKAIGNAVVWFENRVGPLVGSSHDKGGFDMSGSGKHGHMDCIDEASNTTALLLFADKHKLLQHHKVMSPVARGFFLDGRYPHATAVIRQKDKKADFAIDSWVHDNGHYPEIKPLDIWMKESSARS